MKSKKMISMTELLQSQSQFTAINKQLFKLEKLRSYWQKIIVNHNCADNILTFFIHSEPNSLNNGVLSINCESGLIANHARFIKEDIIRELHEAGAPSIKSISLLTSKIQNQQQTAIDKVEREVDKGSLKALKKFTQSCTSEPLKAAAEKLVKSMERQRKKS